MYNEREREEVRGKKLLELNALYSMLSSSDLKFIPKCKTKIQNKKHKKLNIQRCNIVGSFFLLKTNQGCSAENGF